MAISTIVEAGENIISTYAPLLTMAGYSRPTLVHTYTEVLTISSKYT